MTALDSSRTELGTGRLPRLLPGGGPSLEAHRARTQGTPLRTADLLAAVADSGLRGRGGAAFPTAVKMAAVAGATRPTVVVANGTEGEPLSSKDRALLWSNPHAVLDGVAAAAAALGAGRAILCIKAGQPDLRAAIGRAVVERDDERPVEVREAPDRYVTGQETALVHWLNGGEARPTSGRRPHLRGVDGRPTLVDNVETLTHVGLVARYGPDWFREVGTTDEPGSALVTVSGGVGRPGVYEIPLGLPLATLLRQVGAQPPAAVLIGGYFGRWLHPGDVAGTALGHTGPDDAGPRLGCGVVAVIPESSCALSEVAAVAGWYSENSARQCGACEFGLADIARAVRSLLDGDPRADAATRRWTAMVRGRGACQLPDGAAMFVDSALECLGTELAAHRTGGCGRPYGRHLPVPTPGAWR